MEQIRNVTAQEARVGTRYERMTTSGDPMLREIGNQLNHGQVTPAGLLAVPEYRDVIRRGVALLDEASRSDKTATGRAGNGRASQPP
jgi:hypothetical protein